MSKTNTIYTRDEAAKIVSMFEDVLSKYDIKVPSPEDDEREPEDDIGLYGSTYYDLLDGVESEIIGLLEKHTEDSTIIQDTLSGEY